MLSNKRLVPAGISLVVLAAFVLLTGFAINVFADQESPKESIIEQVVQYLKGKNVMIAESKLRDMAATVYEESEAYDLDYRLVLAVMKVESNFKNDAVSCKGARGLLQIKPSLAKYIAKDAGGRYDGVHSLHDADNNIKLGVYHLSNLLDDFKTVSAALHAYNVGENRAKKKLFGNKNNEPKTRFTNHVMKEYQKNLEVLPESE
jgi:soluble lytic murein transglycosylase